jgi:CRP-like cAMP-binding protein
VQRNRILNALSNADLARLQPHLEPTSLKFRQRLQSSNRQIRAVYFPESGIASVVAVGGGKQKWPLFGRDGMTGLPVVHGADRSPCDVFIQMEGEGQCISTENLRRVLEQSPTLLKRFLRYAHVFAVQSGYTALASARGNIEERLARWLLMTRDRVDDDEMVLTHEFVALMLGVRRAGVTGALQAFESKALITTARGSVTIRDRDGLEEAANGLYGAPEAELERLFGEGR